jgi:hypothetical protein
MEVASNGPWIFLKTGPSRLKHFDLAPILHCRNGSSSDFLAKILEVDTPVFLCNTLFHFPLSSLLLLKSRKRREFELSSIIQLVACMSELRAAGVRFPLR